MKLIILDENLQELDKFKIFSKDSENYTFKKYENIPDISESDKKIFNNMDYNIAIYSPVENLNDFYVSFLNNNVLKFNSFNLNDMKGSLISDTFLANSNKKILLNKMKEIYTTNKSKKFYFEYYNKNILIKRLNVNIIRVDNFIYMLGENETDYNFMSVKKNQFFEDYKEPIAIIQDGHVVKCNKRYHKFNKNKNKQHGVNKEIYSKFQNDLNHKIDENINNILERKSYFESFPFEISKNNKLIHYFNLNFNYISYDHKPAVMIIYNDITEQEINRRQIKHKEEEDLFLSKTVDFIQSITNTALVYTVKGKYKYSSKICELLEIKPEKLDENKNIIKDMVIKEDIPLLNNNYHTFKSNHKRREFIIRIKTSKNNIKYLQCYLLKNNKNTIAYYKDITEYQTYLKKLHNALNNSQKLERDLEEIQKISKTAISYNYKGKSQWTKSVCEILKIDYEKYKNYNGNFLRYIVKEDQPIWHEAHSKCSPTQPEANFTIRIKNTKNEIISLNCYVICEYDKKGNELRHVNFYEDITEQLDKENKLKKALEHAQQLEKNFEKIQKISKTEMLYMNDKEKDDIIWYNKGYSTLGLDPSEYAGNMTQYVIEEDKNIWKEKHAMCTPEHPEVSFVQRAYSTGKLRYIKTFLVYEFDENGNRKSHINLFQNITEEIERSNRLQESMNETLKLKDNLNRIQLASKTFITYKGLNYYHITPELFKILEISPKDHGKNDINLIDSYVLDKDLKIRKDNINSLSPENPEVKFIQRIRTDNNKIKYIRTIIHEDYDDNGNLINGISFNQDITEEVTYQNKLKTTLKDKEVLLSEVHHRVKNNLQIILSLINMNLSYENNAKNILENTQNRIYAMALIHEKIYGSDSLSEVNMKDYIESLVESLFELYGSDIQLISDMEPLELEMEQSIPLGLIINELVTNTIKYAFPDKKRGKLYIEFKKHNTHYTLLFKDDGIGLPDDFDLDNLNSLGLIVVTNLTLQIGGIISILDCDGTGYKIEFEEL